MAKIIAIANQKGGVGKTTTAVNLAAAVGARSKRVLLADLDPQGNTTSGYGINRKALTGSAYDVLINAMPIDSAIIKTQFKGVDVLASSIDLAGAEVELSHIDGRENRFRLALSQVADRYDYIFIDCPPALGLITINALCAADTVLIPIQCEYYALEGLSQLMATVRQIKRLYNPELDIEGVLFTMYDGRLNLTNQVAAEVKKFFPKKVFSSVIPRSVRLSEAPSFGQPVIYYDHRCKGSDAYMSLAKEFIKNNRK